MHNTIKATPNSVWNGTNKNQQTINHVIIDRIEGHSYYIKSRTGTILKKNFRGHELISAIGSSTGVNYDKSIEQDKVKAKLKKLEKELG
jgi:hypothetical protein